MEEDYILAKRIVSKRFDEKHEFYIFYILSLYGILRVFNKHKDIVEEIFAEVLIFIEDKHIVDIMRDNGIDPGEYLDYDEYDEAVFAVSSTGHAYGLKDNEFVYQKNDLFIICSTIGNDLSSLTMNFIHEFSHLVKGRINSTSMSNKRDFCKYTIRSGIDIFEFIYDKNKNEFSWSRLYEIFDEVINCLQTEDASREILDLDGIIPDKGVSDFLKRLSREKLTRDDSYLEAKSSFSPLWRNEFFYDLISNNIVEGNIDLIVNNFNSILGKDSFDEFAILLEKIDEMEYFDEVDDIEFKEANKKVDAMIKNFYEKTKNKIIAFT